MFNALSDFGKERSNTLPKAELKTSSKLIRKNGEAEIQAVITLPKSAKGVAFAVHVQAVRTSDGETHSAGIDEWTTILR